MPFYILVMIIQVALVVHVLKTGRPVVWVFILLFAPLIGGLAYVIVELLPELQNSRTGHSLRRGVSNTFNPDRGLKDASRNLLIAETAQNAIELGHELLARAEFEEARQVFERNLKGLHATDSQLLFGLARAQFGLGEFQDVLDTLDTLKEHNPEDTTAEGHLLYARALEGLGRTDEAIVEYETLVGYYSGPEPACRLGSILKDRGETDRARELFEQVLHTSDISGKHYNRLHREWIAMAKSEARP